MTVHADYYDVKHSRVVKEVTLSSGDQTVEGDLVVWNVEETLAAAKAVSVLPFDNSRMSNFRVAGKPLLVIKCSSDASTFNVTVKQGSTTLYTFAADYSTTPAYVALKIDEARDWQLA